MNLLSSKGELLSSPFLKITYRNCNFLQNKRNTMVLKKVLELQIGITIL
jgi:hypothetical protein